MSEKPLNCEEGTNNLDVADQLAGKDSVLILVGFQGIEDTKKEYVVRRLITARNYLTEIAKSRNSSNLVVSKSVNTQPRRWGGIDIYVKGVLLATIEAYPNNDLGLNFCSYDRETDFDQKTEDALRIMYPWRYQ